MNLMDELKVIEINENIFAANDEEALHVKEFLRKENVYMLNFMSSPGAGKTTTLIKLINILKQTLRVALMNVDIETSLDANRILLATQVPSMQINNGGLCHIDADMTYRAIKEFGVKDIDLLILENIGNLVCPAEFDTGANLNITILSIPEGDDKPLKYPLMYEVCDIVIFNKIDTLGVFDFDIEKAKSNILKLNPNAVFFMISAKTGEGLDELATYIVTKRKKWVGDKE